MLIVTGVYGAYGSLSQLITTTWVRPVDEFPVFLITVFSVGLFFSALSVWCGLGVRARQRSRLRALVFFLYVFILWSVGLLFWSYYEYFLLTPPFETRDPALLESLERLARNRVASMVFGTIRVVLESAFIIWAIGHLSSSMIREQFEG